MGVLVRVCVVFFGWWVEWFICSFGVMSCVYFIGRLFCLRCMLLVFVVSVMFIWLFMKKGMFWVWVRLCSCLVSVM